MVDQKIQGDPAPELVLANEALVQGLEAVFWLQNQVLEQPAGEHSGAEPHECS